MSAEVKILLEGYTNADSVIEGGGEKTQPTITLVRDGDLVVVVDPGVLESQQILIDALAKENLTVKDANVVCITHSHIDHYRNIGMFPNAKTLEFFGLWERNTTQDWKEQFTDDIQILRTPGHDYTGITLLVTTKPDSNNPGVVAICGDIFWKENYPADPKDDPYASDPEKLKESREIILKMADWIIPGHGGIYKTDRDMTPPKKEVAAKPKKQIFGICKKCEKPMKTKYDSCRCRPYLCHHCCDCGLDCDLCGCSHKK